MGVDAATGKVWLSMRQVLPDPLQETLDALLARGPPADPSQGGGSSAGGSADDRVSSPEDLSYPEDESSMVCLHGLSLIAACVFVWCVILKDRLKKLMSACSTCAVFCSVPRHHFALCA